MGIVKIGRGKRGNDLNAVLAHEIFKTYIIKFNEKITLSIHHIPSVRTEQ